MSGAPLKSPGMVSGNGGAGASCIGHGTACFHPAPSFLDQLERECHRTFDRALRAAIDGRTWAVVGWGRANVQRVIALRSHAEAHHG